MEKNQFIVTSIKKYEEKSCKANSKIYFYFIILCSIRMLLWNFDDSLKPYIRELIDNIATTLFIATGSYNLANIITYNKISEELKKGLDGELGNTSQSNGR